MLYVERRGDGTVSLRSATFGHRILSLTASGDAVAPVAFLTVKLNGADVTRTEVKAAARRLDGTMTQLEYVVGSIKIEGEGRVDVELIFGNSGPAETDHLSLLDNP